MSLTTSPKSSLKTHTNVWGKPGCFWAQCTVPQCDAKSAWRQARKLMSRWSMQCLLKDGDGRSHGCMYLLGHEDHYPVIPSKHSFWKAYVDQSENTWEKEDAMDIDNEDHVILNNVRGNVVGLSPVLDYSIVQQNTRTLTLYDWVLLLQSS